MLVTARVFVCFFVFLFCVYPRPELLRVFLRVSPQVGSDAGDGGEAVVGFLQFLGLRAGSLGHGAEGERSADQGAAHVTRTQRRILAPVTLHDTRGVGRQTFPRPKGRREEENQKYKRRDGKKRRETWRRGQRRRTE